MHQLKNPGAPFIYGNVPSSFDMGTMVSLYGGPELPMLHAVVGQLGRFYNIPSYGTAGCTDSNAIDAQAGMEAMYSIMMAGLAGTNLVHDSGYIGAGLVGSLEMMLMDNEIIGFTKKFFEGMEVSPETLSVDIIDEVGPGGEYITTEDTLENYKKEMWYSGLLSRKQHVVWKAEGKVTLDRKLNEHVRKLIEQDRSPIMPEDIQREYDAIIARRKKEISEGKFNKEDF
jgi:trimethylamine--corrinoid protein Co-methyltransferase